jgi:hypothetical protein
VEEVVTFIAQVVNDNLKEVLALPYTLGQ